MADFWKGEQEGLESCFRRNGEVQGWMDGLMEREVDAMRAVELQ